MPAWTFDVSFMKYFAAGTGMIPGLPVKSLEKGVNIIFDGSDLDEPKIRPGWGCLKFWSSISALLQRLMSPSG